MNQIPIIGWTLSFLMNCSLAVPFWICWTVCGIGQSYFDWLPPRWQSIPFWNTVGIFICLSVVRSIVPNLIHVSQTNEQPGKKK